MIRKQALEYCKKTHGLLAEAHTHTYKRIKQVLSAKKLMRGRRFGVREWQIFYVVWRIRIRRNENRKETSFLYGGKTVAAYKLKQPEVPLMT